MFERTKRLIARYNQFVDEWREARKCEFAYDCGGNCNNGFRVTNGYNVCSTWADKKEQIRKDNESLIGV